MKELYKATFSQVNTDMELNLDDINSGSAVHTKRNTHLGNRRIVVLAAVIVFVFAGTVVAYATDFLGLRSLLLTNSETSEPTGNPYVASDSGVPDSSVQFISIQGYVGSNEYKATAEWLTFLSGYDQDHTLLNGIGNSPTGLNPKYDLYYVYTQEMADKLEEIVAKYGLKLHTIREIGITDETIYSRFDTQPFLNIDPADDALGYIYDDGTFLMDVMSYETFDGYQFFYGRKGSFTDIALGIHEVDSYEEWQYTTAGGDSVNLALGPDSVFIIADLEDAFVFVNILSGSSAESGDLTREYMESFADGFGFAALKEGGAQISKSGSIMAFEIPAESQEPEEGIVEVPPEYGGIPVIAGEAPEDTIRRWMVDGDFGEDGGLEKHKTVPLGITGGKPWIIDYKIKDVSVLESRQGKNGTYYHGRVIYSIKPTVMTFFFPGYEEKAQGDWLIDIQMEVALYYDDAADFWYLKGKSRGGELDFSETMLYHEK